MLANKEIKPLLFLKAKGLPVKVLDDLPEDIWPELEWLFKDFEILSRARSINSSISLQDIATFLAIFPRKNREFFIRAILSLDEELMSYGKRELVEVNSDGGNRDQRPWSGDRHIANRTGT